jgi:cbb3-type cytochrome oxidase maturation protein
MNIIYLLLALSVLVALIFFIAFIFSVKKGQYDDVYTPSVRMLFDDELVKKKSDKSSSTKNKKSN